MNGSCETNGEPANPQRTLDAGKMEKEHAEIVSMARYIGERRWQAITLFLLLSLTVAGYSLQEALKARISTDFRLMLGGAFLALLLDGSALLIYYRFQEPRKVMDAKLGELEDSLGYKKLKACRASIDAVSPWLKVESLLWYAFILLVLMAITALWEPSWLR